MEGGIKYRGRWFTVGEIDEIKGIIATHPDKSRWFLSREICRQWGWTQPNGVLKDMVCRGLLLRLASAGLVELPAGRRETPYRLAQRKKPVSVQIDQTPLRGSLSDLKPIEPVPVRRTSWEEVYRGLMEQCHYLGYSRPVGEHWEYMAFFRGRVLACLGFCSAPRHIGCRDRYLGWTREPRVRNLSRVVMNTRFLILPWVRVPHLASHLLGRVARRISSDWEGVYGHELVWLETFVDPARGFVGTCYKAANWIYLGQMTGGERRPYEPDQSEFEVGFGVSFASRFSRGSLGSIVVLAVWRNSGGLTNWRKRISGYGISFGIGRGRETRVSLVFRPLLPRFQSKTTGMLGYSAPRR